MLLIIKTIFVCFAESEKKLTFLVEMSSCLCAPGLSHDYGVLLACYYYNVDISRVPTQPGSPGNILEFCNF